MTRNAVLDGKTLLPFGALVAGVSVFVPLVFAVGMKNARIDATESKVVQIEHDQKADRDAIMGELSGLKLQIREMQWSLDGVVRMENERHRLDKAQR